ncbi:hypothetical protein PR048_004831 [Dryococelus australis]|uniref:Uncharacterized protein n=1 Tax=Dryococelus australis TaxID=614101 RepID=A0ABQ9I7E7_9NEOP|nr:hypothetical protein PR048_004831 [Dryococelus australis]
MRLLLDFRMWESCRMGGGFSWRHPDSPPLHSSSTPYILTSLHAHQFSRPRCYELPESLYVIKRHFPCDVQYIARHDSQDCNNSRRGRSMFTQLIYAKATLRQALKMRDIVSWLCPTRPSQLQRGKNFWWSVLHSNLCTRDQLHANEPESAAIHPCVQDMLHTTKANGTGEPRGERLHVGHYKLEVRTYHPPTTPEKDFKTRRSLQHGGVRSCLLTCSVLVVVPAIQDGGGRRMSKLRVHRAASFHSITTVASRRNRIEPRSVNLQGHSDDAILPLLAPRGGPALWSCFPCLRCRGDAAAIPLVSHQGEPSSIPDGVTPGFSHVTIAPLVGGFSRNLPFPPPLHSGVAPYSPCFIPTCKPSPIRVPPQRRDVNKKNKEKIVPSRQTWFTDAQQGEFDEGGAHILSRAVVERPLNTLRAWLRFSSLGKLDATWNSSTLSRLV